MLIDHAPGLSLSGLRLLCLWLSHLHQHIELRHALHAMHGACNGMGSLVAVCLVDEEALPLLVSDM